MPAATTKTVFGYATNLSVAQIQGAFLRFNPDAPIISVGDTIIAGMQSSAGVPGEQVTNIASGDGAFSLPMVAVDNPTWTITVTVDGPNVEDPKPSFIMIPPPASPSSAASAGIGSLIVSAGSGSGIVGGGGTVKSVNGNTPDGNGNVQLSALNTPAFEASGTAAAAVAASLTESLNSVTTSGTAQTLPDATTATLNKITLTGNCTFTFPTAAAGKSFTVVLIQDGVGTRTATWPGTVQWPSGVAPTLTATINKRDVLTFLCVDGTNWLGLVAGQNL